jgi:hypothetical protein
MANHRSTTSLTPKKESKPRARLQKAGKRSSSRNSHTEVIRRPTHSSLFWGGLVDDDAATGVAIRVGGDQPASTFDHLSTTQPQPPIQAIFSVSSTRSIESISNYPEDEMDNGYVRRAKTPCFWIGALDCKSTYDQFDPTNALADQYQDILPPRNFTPYPELSHQRPRKALRKVKGQQSLRDLVTCHRLSIVSTTSSASDSEDTLVGTPSFQISPRSENFPDLDKPRQFQGVEARELPTSSQENDIGFRICLDLLTNELATALFKKHPADGLEKASRLQILLMIEAYEAVQERIRQDSHPNSHMSTMLDNWLAALYSLYDESPSTRTSSIHSSNSASPPLPKRSSKRQPGKDSIDFGDFHFDFESGEKLRAWGAKDERPT